MSFLNLKNWKEKYYWTEHANQELQEVETHPTAMQPQLSADIGNIGLKITYVSLALIGGRGVELNTNKEWEF